MYIYLPSSPLRFFSQVCISTRARKVWWTRSRQLWKFTRTELRTSWTIRRTRITRWTPSWAAREGNPAGTPEICFSSKRTDPFQKRKKSIEIWKFENRERWWEFIMCVRFYRESCNVSTDRAADRAQRKYWLKIIISRRRFVSIVVYDIHDSVNYDSD